MDATGSINLHTFRKPNVIFPNRKIHGGWNFVFASTLIQKANGCKFSVLMRLKVCRLFCGFCGMKTHALGISHSKKYQTCMRTNSNSKCAFYVLFQILSRKNMNLSWCRIFIYKIRSSNRKLNWQPQHCNRLAFICHSTNQSPKTFMFYNISGQCAPQIKVLRYLFLTIYTSSTDAQQY